MNRPAQSLVEYLVDCPECGNEEEYRRTCRRCDQEGFLTSDDERREFPRLAGDPVWDEMTRAQNRAMNLAKRNKEQADEIEKLESITRVQHATIKHQETQIDDLIRQNRALRVVVHDQARQLAVSDYGHKKEGAADASTH